MSKWYENTIDPLIGVPPPNDDNTHQSEPKKKDLDTVQLIRLLDVFLIAPILIYVGTRKGIATWQRVALIIIGILTLLYNGVNYIKNK